MVVNTATGARAEGTDVSTVHWDEIPEHGESFLLGFFILVKYCGCFYLHFICSDRGVSINRKSNAM